LSLEPSLIVSSYPNFWKNGSDFSFHHFKIHFMSTAEVASLTITDIAHRLLELCQSCHYEQAQEELYSEDAVCIEPIGAPMQSVKGLEEIKKKGRAFMNMVEEIHSSTVTGPVVIGNHFAIGFNLDVTLKGAGRQRMEELGVYEVKDGKVIKEQFFA
jgi:hypothetical protein